MKWQLNGHISNFVGITDEDTFSILGGINDEDDFRNLVGISDEDSFSNIDGINDDDYEKDKKDYDDGGEENEDVNCYTHTVMLLGHCIVMCDNDIVKFCDSSIQIWNLIEK